MKLKIKQLKVSKKFIDFPSLPTVKENVGCQYMGRILYRKPGGIFYEREYRRFLGAVKEVIESEAFEAVFSPPFEMRLTDDDCGMERVLLCFYFKTPLTKEELETRFGYRFMTEGGLPPDW